MSRYYHSAQPTHRVVFRWVVALAGATTLAFGGVYWWLDHRLPDVTPLEGAVATGLFDQPPGILPNPPVDIDDIPAVMFDATIAIEDRRFYQHNGVDFLGVVRAIVSNIQAQDFQQGGSSITQQLAKNLYLSPERTWQRKLSETLLAHQIEQLLDKDEILTYYLNRVYFGSQAYGIGAAARIYFNTPVSQLTLPEAALLAGLLQAPSVYSPHVNPGLARDRRNVVLQAMADNDFITQQEADAAIATPVTVTQIR